MSVATLVVMVLEEAADALAQVPKASLLGPILREVAPFIAEKISERVQGRLAEELPALLAVLAPRDAQIVMEELRRAGILPDGLDNDGDKITTRTE